MQVKRSTLLDVFLIASALAYAAYFATLPIDQFIDRDNYFNYIANSEAILNHNISESYFYLFSNEPLWLIINKLVGYFLNPEDGVQLLIYIAAFFYFYCISKEISVYKNNFLILFAVGIFVLFSPQIIKNFIIHIRQGVAIAIFLLTARLGKELLINLFASLLAAQIHSSFYFLFFIFFALFFCEKFKIDGKKAVLVTCMSVLIIAPLTASIGSFFGARQVVDYDFGQNISGLAFLFWFVVIAILSFSLIGEKYIFNSLGLRFGFCAIFLYLCLYFLSPYSGRVFESCLPLILIALLNIPFKKMKYLACMLMGLFIYQWIPVFGDGEVFRMAG